MPAVVLLRLRGAVRWVVLVVLVVPAVVLLQLRGAVLRVVLVVVHHLLRKED